MDKAYDALSGSIAVSMAPAERQRSDIRRRAVGLHSVRGRSHFGKRVVVEGRDAASLIQKPPSQCKASKHLGRPLFSASCTMEGGGFSSPSAQLGHMARIPRLPFCRCGRMGEEWRKLLAWTVQSQHGRRRVSTLTQKFCKAR